MNLPYALWGVAIIIAFFESLAMGFLTVIFVVVLCIALSPTPK